MIKNKRITLNLNEQKVVRQLKQDFDRKVIMHNIKEAKSYILKFKKINEAEGTDLTDYAYKAYRFITDAMFITLKDPILKKEFYRALTDLQNSIEKFLFDYNKDTK
jgi:hypothetical protein